MNSKRYKLIFSSRLNAPVVVSEHCKTAGNSSCKPASAGLGFVNGLARYVGVLSFAYLSVYSAYGAPAVDALPQGGVVAQGAATIQQSNSVMNITQSTDKAIVNWQSFDIGSAASVNVLQPSTSSVLLNRVVGNNHSQIFGSLNANGEVILINPNGILFGRDGSVNASAFTASTLNIKDSDFMSGNYRYFRVGGNGEIINQGAINTRGYVALLGAKVTNDGLIGTLGGNVMLGAAETLALPITNSGRIRMELTPASINTAIENTQQGVIVTQGGQVLVQASAINDAVASVVQTGTINTQGQQGGNVTILADSNIRVSGSINATSLDASEQGGRIVVGRDEITGQLARSADVSGATLESKGGFVETSGDQLKFGGVQVNAADWLLDPYDIVIGTSEAISINSTLNQSSSSVTITTASDYNGNGNGSANGDITLNAALSKNTGNGSTLTLTAARNIVLNADITASGIPQQSLNVTLNAGGNISGAGNINLNGDNGTYGNYGQLILNAGSGAGTLSGVIGGAFTKVTKQGAGTTLFTGANTYGAGTTISAGTLQIEGLGALGTGAITNNANLVFNNITGSSATKDVYGVNALKLTQTITSGTGANVQKTGTGSVILAGDQNKTGNGADYSVTGGTLTLTSNGAGSRYLYANSLKVDGSTTKLVVDANEATQKLYFNTPTLNLNNGSTFDNRTSNLVVENAISINATGSGNKITDTTGGSYINVNTIGPAFTFNTESAGDALTLAVGIKNGTASVVKNGAGTLTITSNNAAGDNGYRGTTTINGGLLQIGNGGTTGTLGGGNVTINNSANLLFNRSTSTTISNNISGTGNVSATITGASSDLTVSNPINLTGGGLINLAADRNITIGANLNTADATDNAIILNAGKAMAAGTSTGGNIIISGTRTITTGAGGRATLYTGSVSGSTGLTSLAGLSSGSGHFRYNSDEAATNYTATLGSGIYAIYREAPSITVQANLTKTYDGQYVTSGSLKSSSGAVALTAGALANGDTLSDANANGVFQFDNASQQKNYQSGEYAITGSQSGSALGYNVTYATGTLIVNKANLTKVTATKVYDGLATVTNAQMTAVEGVNGEIFSATGGTANISDKNVATANKTVTDLSGLTLTSSNGGLVGNYNLSSGLPVAGSNNLVTITKNTIANVVLTANSDSKVYNGITQSVTGFTAAGLVGDDVNNSAAATSGISAGASGKNVGSYTTSFSGSNADLASNYQNISYVNSALVITKANATVTANSGTATYNGQLQSVSGFSATGLVNGESASVLTSVSASGSGTNAGTYSTTASGTDANYNLSFVNGSLVIGKANATVTANSGTATYNGQLQSVSGFTASGLVNGESASVLTGVTASGSGTNAGNYTTIASGTDTNYNLSFVNGSFVIGKATITASLIGSVSKQYNGLTNATLSSNNFSLSGFASGEGAAVNQTAGSYSSPNVSANNGSGTVTANLASNNFTATGSTNFDNYILPSSATGNVGTITPAALTIKVNNTSAFVTQDARNATDQGLSYIGFVNGEGSSVLSNIGSRTYSNGGNNTPVAGTYTGVYGLSTTPTANNGNYSITVQSGNLTVVPADKLLITVSSQTDTYGNRTSPNQGAASSVSAQYCFDSQCSSISSLTVTQLNGTQWRASDNTNSYVVFDTTINSSSFSAGGYLNAGNYAYSTSEIAPLSLPNGNFNKVTNGGVLTIMPKALTLTAGNVSKVYDGSASLTGVVLTPTGALGSDKVSANASSGSFASANAATGLSFALNGLVLSGSDAANYSLPTTSLSGTGSITPKTLTITGGSAQDKFFDGNTSVVYSAGTLSGLVGSETLNLGSSAAFADSVVGNNKNVLVTYSVTDGTNGGLASNYAFASNPYILQASIKPKAVVVNDNKKPFVNPVSTPKSAPLEAVDVKTHITISTNSAVSDNAVSANLVKVSAAPKAEAKPLTDCTQTLMHGVTLCFLASD